MPVKLGELLLKESMVSPQQLQEALTHQKMNGGKLGKALVGLLLTHAPVMISAAPRARVSAEWEEEGGRES